MSTFALRGGALTFVGDPFLAPTGAALRHETDALVVIRDGRIVDFGAAAALLPDLPAGVPVTRYDNALLLPGFIDATISAVMRRGAGFPGISAVVMMMSTSAHCSAYSAAARAL